MSTPAPIIIDTSSAEVVEHFATKLNISRVAARLFLEGLQHTAVSGEVQGVESVSQESALDVLEGTVVSFPEHEEGVLDPFRDVMSHSTNPSQEEILISQLTGLSVEAIRELGGVPQKKDKPFKTGFNA